MGAGGRELNNFLEANNETCYSKMLGFLRGIRQYSTAARNLSSVGLAASVLLSDRDTRNVFVRSFSLQNYSLASDPRIMRPV